MSERESNEDADTNADANLQRLVRFGQAILVILGAVVVVSAITTPTLDALVGAGVLVADTGAYVVARTIIQCVAYVVAVGGYVAATRDVDLLKAHAPTNREFGLMAVGVAVLLGGQFGLIALFSALGVDIGQNQAVVAGEGNPGYYLSMVLVSLLFVGPAEELLFRGGVQGVLRKAYGPRSGVALATVLFGLIHYPGIVGTPGQRAAYVLIAILLGGLLGALYEWTDNLLVPAVVHGGYNATLYALQYADAVGAM